MSTPAIGERAYQRYIKHPAASTSNPLSNGWAIDGTMQLFDSNASHLTHESVRPLVSTLGPGLVTTQDSYTKFWTGFTDSTEFAGGASGTYRAIPWDRRTAVRFGPFALTPDRFMLDGTDGGVTGNVVGISFREIAVLVDTTMAAANSVQKVYVALTRNASPQSIFDDSAFPTRVPVGTDPTGAMGALTLAISGTGQQRVTGTFRPDVPLAPRLLEGWTCRPVGTYGGAVAQVYKGYLWVGWELVNAGAVSNYINAISAWEIR